MPTPIIELEAIRGTDFSQIVTLADNLNAPVSTNNAQGLFILRTHERGTVVVQKTNSNGISFGTSNMEIRLTESELDAIQYNTLHYDLFLHLQGDVKKNLVQFMDEDFFPPITPQGSTLKIWNGSAYVEVTLKRYNGTSWQDCSVKLFKGSVWE